MLQLLNKHKNHHSLQTGTEFSFVGYQHKSKKMKITLQCLKKYSLGVNYAASTEVSAPVL